jgi:hypothetical protein
MKKNTARILGLVAGTIATMVTANAQSIIRAEKILAVGDMPSWAGGGSVTEISTPFVGSDGSVGFAGTINPDGLSQAFVFNESGTPFIDATVSAYTLTGHETTMGLASGGRFIYSPSINGNDGIWTSDGYLIADRDVAPGVSGKFIKFASGPRMYGDGNFSFMAGYANVPGGTTTDRALYRGKLGVPGLTLVYKTGDVVAGETLRFATPNLSFRYDSSDNALHTIHIAGVGTGSSGLAYVLKDLEWIARPGEAFIGTPYENEAWNTFSSVGVNNSGEWIITGESSNFDSPSSNGFVAFNGISSAHENDTLDGVTLTTPAAVRVASVNNLGQVAHLWSVGSGSPTPKVLFVGPGSSLTDSRRIVGSGDVLDFDGDGLGDFRVYDLPESVIAGPGIDLGDDGRVVTRVQLENAAGGGTRFDAIVRFCYENCSSCPACPADYNSDGGVDGTDIGAFFPEWEASASCADVNQDGGVDGGDIEAFFTVWEAGGC